MLAIQRDVPGELVHEQPGGEADVGAAAFQNPGRCRQTDDLCARLDLNYRPADFEDMVGARSLGNPVRHLLADHLVLIGRQAFDIGVHQREGLDRNLRLVEERQLLAALRAIVLRGAPCMSRNRLELLDGRGRHRERLAEVHLQGIGFGGKSLALLAKDLTAEPLELVLEGRDLLGLRADHGGELRGAHRRIFSEAR